MSNEQDISLKNEGLLTKDELKAFLHIKGDATIWNYLKQGKLPQPTIKINKNKQWWNINEVLAHLDKHCKG